MPNKYCNFSLYWPDRPVLNSHLGWLVGWFFCPIYLLFSNLYIILCLISNKAALPQSSSWLFSFQSFVLLPYCFFCSIPLLWIFHGSNEFITYILQERFGGGLPLPHTNTHTRARARYHNLISLYPSSTSFLVNSFSYIFLVIFLSCADKEV